MSASRLSCAIISKLHIEAIEEQLTVDNDFLASPAANSEEKAIREGAAVATEVTSGAAIDGSRSDQLAQADIAGVYSV